MKTVYHKEKEAGGIERKYLHSYKNNIIINETDKWNKFAKDNNLFVTIGSDFHMNDAKHAEIGLENVGLMLSEKEISDILNNLKE